MGDKATQQRKEVGVKAWVQEPPRNKPESKFRNLPSNRPLLTRHKPLDAHHGPGPQCRGCSTGAGVQIHIFALFSRRMKKGLQLVSPLRRGHRNF